MFRSAGATGHVLTRSGGKTQSRGLGWSGIIGPTTIIAVVPTTTQLIPFSVDAYGLDQLVVRVTGSSQGTLDPNKVQSTFDFTVDRFTGSYDQQWATGLQALITEQVLGPIRKSAEGMDVATAVKSQAAFAEALQAQLSQSKSLTEKGINVTASSVGTVDAANSDVAKAIGAEQRERLLTGADAATHKRRIKAAENARAVQTYEAETKLKLEQANANLISQQGKNKIEVAKAEAEATELRLRPLTAMNPATTMAAALMTAAEKGNLGNVSLTTDLLALLRGETKPKDA